MYQMNDEERAERAKIKKLHQAIRAYPGRGQRYWCLAWGFVRGFKYRRIERSHHMQEVSAGANVQIDGKSYYEHNLVYPKYLHNLIVQFVPEVTVEQVTTWLNDRTGAIPLPAPRPKKVITNCAECGKPIYALQADLPAAHQDCATPAMGVTGKTQGYAPSTAAE